MADSLSYQGSLTLGQCFPRALEAVGHLDVSLGVALPELQGKLAGVLNMLAALRAGPPDLEGTINAALAVVAALQAAIGGPTVTLQAEALAALLASIEIDLGSLQLGVSFSAELALLLGTAGLHMYTYTGRADGLGPLLAAQLSGGVPGGLPEDPTGAVVLVATTAAPRVALGAFCGVTLAIE